MAPTLVSASCESPGGDGLEGEGADVTLAVDSPGSGGTRGGDGDEAVALVAVDDGDRLPIAPEEVACIDVDELEDLGVELHLQRNGVEVVSVGRRRR